MKNILLSICCLLVSVCLLAQAPYDDRGSDTYRNPSILKLHLKDGSSLKLNELVYRKNVNQAPFFLIGEQQISTERILSVQIDEMNFRVLEEPKVSSSIFALERGKHPSIWLYDSPIPYNRLAFAKLKPNKKPMYYSFPDSAIHKLSAKNIRLDFPDQPEAAKLLKTGNAQILGSVPFWVIAGLSGMVEVLYIGYLTVGTGDLGDSDDRREFLITTGIFATSSIISLSLYLNGNSNKRAAIKMLTGQP